jgi:hypothetical protein
MKVNGIDHLGYIINIEKTPSPKKIEPEQHAVKDQLVLSDEAKRLKSANSSLTPERLDLIRQRIAEKFYDQDEVINEIAGRILKSDIFKEFQNGGNSTKKS